MEQGGGDEKMGPAFCQLELYKGVVALWDTL